MAELRTPGTEAGQSVVLIVDDEANVRGILERSLADKGYEVLVAGSAGEAVELVKAWRGLRGTQTERGETAEQTRREGGGLSRTLWESGRSPFKTAAFNHSATTPEFGKLFNSRLLRKSAQPMSHLSRSPVGACAPKAELLGARNHALARDTREPEARAQRRDLWACFDAPRKRGRVVRGSLDG